MAPPHRICMSTVCVQKSIAIPRLFYTAACIFLEQHHSTTYKRHNFTKNRKLFFIPFDLYCIECALEVKIKTQKYIFKNLYLQMK